MEGSELEELLRKIAPESHTTCELPGDILCLYKGGTFYHWFLFIFSRIRAATSLTFFVLILLIRQERVSAGLFACTLGVR